jgi:hypothetical protein
MRERQLEIIQAAGDILTSYLEKSRRVAWPAQLIFFALSGSLIAISIRLIQISGNNSVILQEVLIFLGVYLVYLYCAGLALISNAPCTDKEWAVIVHALSGSLIPLVSWIILKGTANEYAESLESKADEVWKKTVPTSIDYGITGIFISYRRKDGIDLARNIRFVLKEARIADCSFFDIESLGEGSWNEQIEEAIEKSNCFLILLTPSSLEKRGENDYFLREVKTILAKDPTKNKVIPVLAEQFSWPSDLQSPFKELAERQDIEISSRYFDASMERLIAYIKGDSKTGI